MKTQQEVLRNPETHERNKPRHFGSEKWWLWSDISRVNDPMYDSSKVTASSVSSAVCQNPKSHSSFPFFQRCCGSSISNCFYTCSFCSSECFRLRQGRKKIYGSSKKHISVLKRPKANLGWKKPSHFGTYLFHPGTSSPYTVHSSAGRKCTVVISRT